MINEIRDLFQKVVEPSNCRLGSAILRETSNHVGHGHCGVGYLCALIREGPARLDMCVNRPSQNFDSTEQVSDQADNHVALLGTKKSARTTIGPNRR